MLVTSTKGFNMKTYAGLGDKEVSENAGSIIFNVGKKMAENNYLLRSGGAEGVDTFFEKGCDLVKGNKEIFTPWVKSNKYKEAEQIAKGHTAVWFKPKGIVQKILTRNVFILLGKELNKPVDLVLVWQNGETDVYRHLVRTAASYNIRVYNLAEVSVRELTESLK